MKAIILQGGYGTRLEKDIKEDTSGEYDQLKGSPKSLLPVADKPLINYWIEEIEKSGQIDKIYIVTNGLNYLKFAEWAGKYGFPIENLVNNNTLRNEDRLGAIGDLGLVVEEKRISDDVLVVAGDLLFYPDFGLEEVLNYFGRKKGEVVTCYEVEGEWLKKKGAIELDEENRITKFAENPEGSKSSLRCPAFYVYRRETIRKKLFDFLNEKKDKGVTEIDGSGKFVAWLYSQGPVYAFRVSGRFDVGNLEDYKKVNEFFRKIKKEEC